MILVLGRVADSQVAVLNDLAAVDVNDGVPGDDFVNAMVVVIDGGDDARLVDAPQQDADPWEGVVTW